MIFFTRALQEGIQDNSGWTRRAWRTWDRNERIYAAYFKTITPLLPRSVRRLCEHGLHDARVESVSQQAGTLRFVMNARHALGGFRGRRVELTFSGVRRRIAARGLAGKWWLYAEAHLSSHAAFVFHVSFDTHEVEIEANALNIRLIRFGAK